MLITIQTEEYDPTRYGVPWIAVVDFFANPRGSYRFGKWIGGRGGAGTLSIKAKYGDIIATGQKSLQRASISFTVFSLVGPSGGLTCLGYRDKAYKYFLAHKSSQHDLLAERVRLQDRLSEIDGILEKESR